MKRVFDFLVALFLIIVLAIPLVGIFLCVRFFLGAPALFCQIRPGLNGNPFKMYKFRTMSNKRDENGQLLPDHLRLTKFGIFLRSSSLDELPELWNVLIGDMSLVGPRPLLMEYLPLYSKEQYRRHEVKPGITGWAQINGRNAISWNEKFNLDVWYVDRCNFFLDVKILLLTLFKVFMRKDINSGKNETMPAFKGYNEESRHDA